MDRRSSKRAFAPPLRNRLDRELRHIASLEQRANEQVSMSIARADHCSGEANEANLYSTYRLERILL